MRNLLFNRTFYFLLIILPIIQGCSLMSPFTQADEEPNQQLPVQVTPPPAVLITDDYRIRPGDEIEILVWEQPSFNTLTRVSAMGTITLPLVGELSVGGLTKEELTRDLERNLEQYIRGEINLTVSIRNTDNMLVSVFGMVSRPDSYPVTDATSIFRVLSIAGGPSDEADLRMVKIYHQNGNNATSTLDLTHYLETGQMNSSSLMVMPGDIIYVPKKQNAVREMSEFLRDVVILFGIFRVFN